MEVLRAGAKSLGLELSAAQERQFHRYREGLVQWDRRVNLTSPAALADVERVHFLDSLSVVPLVRREAAETARLIDVGAGAGFPGVPLKLLLPGLRLTLVEATGKKADFLRWLVAELGLKDVDVRSQRAEELAHQPGYREAFDVATARALGSLATVLELTLPFCTVGGLVVAQRAGDVAAEASDVGEAALALGGRVRSVVPVRLVGLRDDARGPGGALVLALRPLDRVLAVVVGQEDPSRRLLVASQPDHRRAEDRFLALGDGHRHR